MSNSVYCFPLDRCALAAQIERSNRSKKGNERSVGTRCFSLAFYARIYLALEGRFIDKTTMKRNGTIQQC